MKRIVAGAAFACAMLSAASTFAVTVTYTFTALTSGTVAAAPYTSQATTYRVTGDSTAVVFGPGTATNVLTGGTVTIAGTACAGGCTITNPSNFIVYNLGPSLFIHGISTVGNAEVSGQTLFEGCFGASSPCFVAADVNDNLRTNVPLSVTRASGVAVPYMAVATSGGIVQINSVDLIGDFHQMGYSVSVPTIQIPAMSPWSIAVLALLVALGALGFLRRRTPA